MTLGERILENRKRCGLSQEQLAERLEISRQAVSKWELNDAVPDVDKIVALAKVYGITTDELLLGERPQAPELAEQEHGSLNRLARLIMTKGYRVGYVLLAYGGAILVLAVVAGVLMYHTVLQSEPPAPFLVVLGLGALIGLSLAAAGIAVLVRHKKGSEAERK